MQITQVEGVQDLVRRWTDAEQGNDAVALEVLLSSDFRAVGPRGFVLDKQQWLDRYRSGALVTRSLKLDEVAIRAYGATAILVGREDLQAAHQGRAAGGQFRITLIAVLEDDAWRIAGLQLSPIAEGA